VQYTGKKIARAGDDLRVFDSLSDEALKNMMEVISFWRQAHEEPVKNALDLLSSIVIPIDKTALFARRMKRTASIHGKLIRYPKMSLYKMNDIGGCRVIIRDRQSLYKVLKELRKRPEFQILEGNGCKINDYIKDAKADGYRSVHIIGKFAGADGTERFVEVQLRTPIQHCWATAVEIVDLFTNQSLKTNQGSPEWSSLFIQLSSHFDVMDKVKSFVNFNHRARFKFYSDQMKTEFGKALLDRDSLPYIAMKQCNDCLVALNVVQLFDGFANSLNIVDEKHQTEGGEGYVLITIDLEKSEVTAQTFPPADEEAEKAYAHEELIHSGNSSVVVAMVSTPKLSELRLAYPNYFADSTVFISCVLCITDYFATMQANYFSKAVLPRYQMRRA
jgi:ppGpp synthetase/RelA/SpoT-type nucleotidyltranferase